MLLLLFIGTGSGDTPPVTSGGHHPVGRRRMPVVIVPDPIREDEDGLFVVRIL